MAIPKVMGIETEYGITVKNQPDFNPILSSLLLINSYETFRSSRVRWDYEAESPLRDARGFEYMEEKEGTSKEESRLINLILSNGARFYVDHAHPEYSSPETTNPRDLVIWDRAGERILNLSRQRAEAVSPPEQRILIYKNNTDNKGNSYGTHENYLMDRKVPFARIVQHMMPFFVSRQVFTGAGKVGAENNADPCDYQISQRADFLETEVGLETMHSRPIINTRDEPHADPEKYRRLHVIVGDANMSEVSNYLKVGTMAMVLASMVEDDFIERDLSVDGPVGAFRVVSRDLTCRETFRLKDGRTITAVDLQREFLALAHRYYRDREHEPWVREVLTRWESDARPAGRGSDAARPRARLGHQAPAHRELHGQARPGVERLTRGHDRPPVPRHPAGPRPLLQARGVRGGRPHRRPTTRSRRRSTIRPRTRARTSAACACSATRTRSSRRAGIR